MNQPHNRRAFLRNSTVAAAGLTLVDLGFLTQLRPVSAEDAKLPHDRVQFAPEIEPLVRLLEETPRQRVLEEFARRIKNGTSYREVLSALLLAGVRNIQPRPVGFKFHAVLVVNSAHLASLNSPDGDRWLPIFWALDQFKSSQARDSQEGDWTMGAVDETAVPPPHRAKAAFIEAMENWDVAAADAAVAGLARSAGAQEVFECFVRYGARDFRDIGHKAIYVANSWRTLQNIGWRHSEPVLRSLAYALLEHEGTNPARRNATADRAGRHNQALVDRIRADWLAGQLDPGGSTTILSAIRGADELQAAEQAVELLNSGVSARSIWDGLFAAAAELLMRQPGILSLHSVTSANALHYSWQRAGHEPTRRWLLLQAASFLSHFRQALRDAAPSPIDELDQVSPNTAGAEAIQGIFAEVNRDRKAAARQALGFLRAGGEPGQFINAARRLIYLKGTNSHDYKFSEAALENYFDLSASWRDRFLAASLFYLRGSEEPDNELVQRTRQAFSV